MSWHIDIKGFSTYLRLERSLSPLSVKAYQHDLQLLEDYLESTGNSKSVSKVTLADLRNFLKHLSDKGIEPTSQARVVSGIKAFYKYAFLENIIQTDPTELLEAPKTSRKLPEVLEEDEIRNILQHMDLTKPEGERNKAIIQTLYSCGLRVSECVDLKISHIYFKEEFIRVIGKGNKERLVPIGPKAIKQIKFYQQHTRNHQRIKKGHEDILFLNRRGAKLTRVMLFHIIKEAVKNAGIKKTVSPHTFRHSFATQLVKGGADLRAVQEMLGHESITTTEIYTHLDRTFLTDTIRQYHPRA